MRKLTPEEFFEKVDAYYDEEKDTITMKYKGNMVWDIDGNVVSNATGDVLNYSGVKDNKKFFYNTGSFDPSISVEENIKNAKNIYEKEMRKYYKRIEEMENTTVDIKS